MPDNTIELKKQSVINCENGLTIHQIYPSRQYWFIRTDSGNYYHDFILNGYVAIGWDYLHKNNFVFNSPAVLTNEAELKCLIDANEPLKTGQSDKSRKSIITKIFNKVSKFIFELEQGDIVITPSENSNMISIGIIIGDLYEEPNYEEKFLKENPDSELTPCPFLKRRKVHWIKHIPRNEIDIYLLNSFQSQEAMTNLNHQAQYINRNLYDAYIIGDCFHSILKTTSYEEASLAEITLLFEALSQVVTNVATENLITLSPNNISIKINAHSPAMIDLSIMSDIVTTIAPILGQALAVGGIGGISISTLGKYFINKTTQKSETERNQQNNFVELAKIRAGLKTEEERIDFDKFVERAGLLKQSQEVIAPINTTKKES